MPTNLTFIKFCFIAVMASWLLAVAAFGQTPPPNDNYSNSITLTGTDITFSGTLAGATIEDSQETNGADLLFYLPTQSVWWNWTAPEGMDLTLEIVNTSFQLYTLQSYPWSVNSDGLFIYEAANGSSSPSGLALPTLGAIQTTPRLLPQTISIPVTGGLNYQIQLLGNSSANYTIRLMARKNPVIITQPRSQTVYPGAAITFYALYAGVGQTNFSFKWYRNGTNLPGETAPMLALTNIDSGMAGSYTAAVGNSAGATVSAPATLTVTQSNVPISLDSPGFAIANFPPSLSWASNAFVFTVNGEAGRSYRLESSGDLTNWSSEMDFPMSGSTLTGVYFQTNTSQFMASPFISGRKFFRVLPYLTSDPHAEICVNNLRQISIAKLLWGRDHIDYASGGSTTPLTSDILPYLPHQMLPSCPDDGIATFDTSYVMANLQTPPVCKINFRNHIFFDPR